MEESKRFCVNCRMAVLTPVDEKAIECRAALPSPIVIQARTISGNVPIVLGGFPLVEKFKWCGKFELANDHATRFNPKPALSVIQ